MCLVQACARAESAALPVSEAAHAKLREVFSYSSAAQTTPTPLAPPAREIADRDEVVTMDAFTVTEYLGRRSLEKAIRDRSGAADDRAFHWYKGGLIASKTFGNKVADLGIWPTLIVRQPGRVGTQLHPFLRIDVLRIRW